MNIFAISSTSANKALGTGLKLLMQPETSYRTESRNGPVIVATGPVNIVNYAPMNRVLFGDVRDANPFFHLFEAMWMLGGRNDLTWLAQFNKRMASYSDDGGKTQPAAYGHRWLEFFGIDQIGMAVAELRANPNSRRAVIGMWDPAHDPATVAAGGADVPCNTQCFFTLRDGKLDMGVTCRSNDMLWGAHGANLVHFSILQEYIAALLSVEIGTLVQWAWNYHVYCDVVNDPVAMFMDLADNDFYASRAVMATPLFNDVGWFTDDLPIVLDYMDPASPPRVLHSDMHPTFSELVVPMFHAWQHHKQKRYDAALAALSDMPTTCDWAVASALWLHKRADAYAEKANG